MPSARSAAARSAAARSAAARSASARSATSRPTAARSATSRPTAARSAAARSATSRATGSRSAARPATARPAARRQARRPQRVPVRSAALRVRWERVGRYGLLLVLAIVVGLYAEHTVSYLSTSSQADQQQAAVSRLARQNRGLERQMRALNDPVTIVRDARSLGMVRPGERSYAMTGQPQR